MDRRRLDLDDLARSLEKVRNLSFPSPEHALDEDEADELDITHAELAQHRSAIAGPVLSLLNRRTSKVRLSGNEPLRRRIDQLIMEGSPQAATEVEEHARYLDALDELVGRAAPLAETSSLAPTHSPERTPR